jgi:hypothetical protein
MNAKEFVINNPLFVVAILPGVVIIANISLFLNTDIAYIRYGPLAVELFFWLSCIEINLDLNLLSLYRIISNGVILISKS